jgi:hypothetical protein
MQLRGSERAAECTAFLTDALDFFAGLGALVERVMTDNAMTRVMTTCGLGHARERYRAGGRVELADSAGCARLRGCQAASRARMSE